MAAASSTRRASIPVPRLYGGEATGRCCPDRLKPAPRARTSRDCRATAGGSLAAPASSSSTRPISSARCRAPTTWTSCSRTSTRRGSPPANAPAPGDFQSSAKRRSAVVPQELSTAVRIQRLAASVLAIRARDGTARGSFVSPRENAAWNRTRESGSPAIASARSRNFGDASSRPSASKSAWARTCGTRSAIPRSKSSSRSAPRPWSVQSASTRVWGRGACASWSSSRNGPTADLSCRS